MTSTQVNPSCVQHGATLNYSTYSQWSVNNTQPCQFPTSPVVVGVGQYGQYNTSTPIPLQTQQPCHSMTIDPFTLILNRLDAMDLIENTVNGLTGQMNDIGQQVRVLEGKMTEIENRRNFDSGRLEEMKLKHKEIDSLKYTVRTMEQERNECENMIKGLKRDELKNNLLVDDRAEETNENCTERVRKIITENMKVENGMNIDIQSAERIGRFRAGTTRPSVVKFKQFDDRESVRMSCKNLKG